MTPQQLQKLKELIDQEEATRRAHGRAVAAIVEYCAKIGAPMSAPPSDLAEKTVAALAAATAPAATAPVHTNTLEGVWQYVNEHPHTTRRAVRRAFGGSKAVYSTVTKLLAQGRLRETGLGELVAAVPGA